MSHEFLFDIHNYIPVFDRAYGDQAHAEYMACYKEFNGMVTTLIECFCGDVGIELGKFRQAIATLSQQRLSRQQRVIIHI